MVPTLACPVRHPTVFSPAHSAFARFADHSFEGGSNVLRKHFVCTTALLFALALLSSPAQAKHWVYLGNAHVDGNVDHDNIHVGGPERFHTIQLRVEGGAVEFQRVVVHFADGTQEELRIQDRVRSGGKSHEVDLPGEHRAIDSVELWYAKEKWENRPEVRLYAAR
jgi:hypothetical protein